MTTGPGTFPGARYDAASATAPAGGTREAIVDALLRLAARRDFGATTITDIAREAGVSLADFRDAFPSKGAVLGAFLRRIDRKVLENPSRSYEDEPSRERLYHVLSHRLDALEPYRDAVLNIAEWAAKDPLSATALNREIVNSMRFMLEAADIDSEGPVGALKLQGLAHAWKKVLDAWREDRAGEHARALSALDRELSRGEKFVDRAEDLVRMTEPFFSLAQKLFDGAQRRSGRHSHHHHHEAEDDYEHHPHASA